MTQISTIYSAGSLRNVLPVLMAAFRSDYRAHCVVKYGPAGLLCEKIAAGDRPDLFLSANSGHPARLADLGISGQPVVFARNNIVALALRDAHITTNNFIDRVLSPDVAVATSTPLCDPSGDYAWEIFRKIDQAKPGALQILNAKAKKLVGGATPAPSSDSYDMIGRALRSRTATLFIGYQTGLGLLAERETAFELVNIPPEVKVIPEYAMAALNECLF